MKHKNLQTEIDASYLYRKLAEHEQYTTIAEVSRQMRYIENGHATALVKNENVSLEKLQKPS